MICIIFIILLWNEAIIINQFEPIKRVRQWLRQIIKIKKRINILCGILTVKLNNDITRNLQIELICEIVSYTYKFKHEFKFQPVLQNIEDGIMCVLRTLTLPMLRNDLYSREHSYWRLETWYNRMQPRYNVARQYEGASRYFAKQDHIITSKKLKKQHKWCKYQTRSNVARRVARFLQLKKRYCDMDQLSEYVDKVNKYQCFKKYFFCK